MRKGKKERTWTREIYSNLLKKLDRFPQETASQTDQIWAFSCGARSSLTPTYLLKGGLLTHRILQGTAVFNSVFSSINCPWALQKTSHKIFSILAAIFQRYWCIPSHFPCSINCEKIVLRYSSYHHQRSIFLDI